MGLGIEVIRLEEKGGKEEREREGDFGKGK